MNWVEKQFPAFGIMLRRLLQDLIDPVVRVGRTAVLDVDQLLA
jgi:hypothetical protein